MTKELDSILEEQGYTILEKDLEQRSQGDKQLGKIAYWRKEDKKDGIIIWLDKIGYMDGDNPIGSYLVEYPITNIYMVGPAHKYFKKLIKKKNGKKLKFKRAKMIFKDRKFNVKELTCSFNYFKEQLSL